MTFHLADQIDQVLSWALAPTGPTTVEPAGEQAA
jgi:hypothetical protein